MVYIIVITKITPELYELRTIKVYFYSLIYHGFSKEFSHLCKDQENKHRHD